MLFDDEKKIKRLKEREANLLSKGYKAVDEGRDKKANRILGRAANLENRIITLEEKNNMPMKNAAIDMFNKNC
jgi:phage shock protein A